MTPQAIARQASLFGCVIIRSQLQEQEVIQSIDGWCSLPAPCSGCYMIEYVMEHIITASSMLKN